MKERSVQKTNGAKINGEMKTFPNLDTNGIVNIIAVGNNKVLTGSENGDIRLWALTKSSTSHNFYCERLFSGHSKKILCMTVLPNNSFVSSSADNTLRIWDITSGNCKKILKEGSSISPVDCEAIVVLPDNLIATTGNRTPAWGCFDVWDVETGKCIFREKSAVHRPRGMSIAVAKGYLAVHPHCHDKLTIWKINREECTQVSQCDSGRIYSMGATLTGEIITGGHDLNIFTISDKGIVDKHKTLENGNVIDTIIPLYNYSMLTVDRQRNSGILKLCNYLLGENKYLGDSITPTGKLSTCQIVLAESVIVLSISDGKFCIQEFPSLLQCQKFIAEIRKNSRLISQAVRTGTSFFSFLPKELNIKIAALTANSNDEITSEKISSDHFCKPQI